MSDYKQKFCFCTLALGKPYQKLAKQLAEDLEKFASNKKLVILTDDPKFFSNNVNVLASKYIQQSPLFPFNEKRRVLEKALQEFSTAIFVDADSRIVDYFPNHIDGQPGIVVDCDSQRSFAANVRQYCPNDIHLFEKLANKIDLKKSLEDIPFPMQSLYLVTRDSGKEKDFLENWDRISKYLEIHRCSNVSDGYSMGLALASVEWIPAPICTFEYLRRTIKHMGFKKNRPNKNFVQLQMQRLLFHYRLNKIRLDALKDFEFFFE